MHLPFEPLLKPKLDQKLKLMSFTIPSEIDDFFGRYSNALDVFVDTNGKSYLNHFEAKAKRDVDVSGATLYRVTSDLAYVPVHPAPTLNSYSLEFAPEAVACICNGESANIGEPVGDPLNVKTAMEQACDAAGVIVADITVDDLGGNLRITVETLNTATFMIDDAALVLV